MSEEIEIMGGGVLPSVAVGGAPGGVSDQRDALGVIRGILDALPPPRVIVASLVTANVLRARAGVVPLTEADLDDADAFEPDWQIKAGEEAAGPDAPPRVENIEQHWGSFEPPSSPSPRLRFWAARIRDGWKPPERIAHWGYYESAEIYGVWIWEVFHVLWPLLGGKPIEPDVAAWLEPAR